MQRHDGLRLFAFDRTLGTAGLTAAMAIALASLRSFFLTACERQTRDGPECLVETRIKACELGDLVTENRGAGTTGF
jgi:hypothetical protein